MQRTLIKCGWLVTMDLAIGDLADAEILIVGDRIAAVGKALKAESDVEIDASDKIVMPGLINAHLHIWQGMLRGIGSEWVGDDYFRIVSPRIAPLYQPDDNYLASLLGALAQIADGVTTIGDYCHNLTSDAQAARSVDGLEESGIRAAFFQGGGRVVESAPGEADRLARESVRAMRRDRLTSDDRRVTLGFAMAGPEYSSWETTLADIHFARDLGLKSTSHSSRAPDQRMTVDGYLELVRLGLVGPDHSIVHGNALSDSELIPLLDCGAPLIATVLQEYRSMKPDPIVNRARARGALPALGTDNEMIAGGCMLREMQTALIVARHGMHSENSARGLPPLKKMPVRSREALDWATIGGARALGLESEIGSLTPGKKADLIMLRANDGNLFPSLDPVNAIAETAHGGNVDTVMIDGELRKRDGQLLFPADLLSTRRSQMREAGQRLLREADYSWRAE